MKSRYTLDKIEFQFHEMRSEYYYDILITVFYHSDRNYIMYLTARTKNHLRFRTKRGKKHLKKFAHACWAIILSYSRQPNKYKRINRYCATLLAFDLIKKLRVKSAKYADFKIRRRKTSKSKLTS